MFGKGRSTDALHPNTTTLVFIGFTSHGSPLEMASSAPSLTLLGSACHCVSRQPSAFARPHLPSRRVPAPPQAAFKRWSGIGRNISFPQSPPLLITNPQPRRRPFAPPPVRGPEVRHGLRKMGRRHPRPQPHRPETANTIPHDAYYYTCTYTHTDMFTYTDTHNWVSTCTCTYTVYTYT